MKKFNVIVNGKSYAVEVEEVGTGQVGFTYAPVQHTPVTQPLSQEVVTQVAEDLQQAPVKKVSAGPVLGETISAPMPGTILDVKVTEGQSVKAGDVLLILEAMKMENEIVSPKSGVVEKIYSFKSDIVNTGDPLVTIE